MQVAAIAGERGESGITAANPLVQFGRDSTGRIEELIRLLYSEAAHQPGGLRQLRSFMFSMIARLPSEHMLVHRRASQLQAPAADSVTRRERDVLRLMGCGLSNRRIARELQIGSQTVKSHVKSIFIKLAVRTRADTVIRGSALGLI